MSKMKPEDALKLLSKSPDLLNILNKELAMPNIPFPTMGGEVFWTDLAEANGWKLQQNMFTHHARILNSENVRVAWGTVNGMYRAMDRLVAAASRYKYNNEEAISYDDTMKDIEMLKKLKELFDSGIITEEEYQQKKTKYMKNI